MFTKNLLVFSSAALLWGLIPTSNAAHAEIVVKDGTPRYVETTLIPEFNSITAGQPFNFAIHQKHTEGWHTYWKNPGDSGESTSIEWSMPEGFKANEITFPAPERQPSGPLMNFGFSGDNTLLTSIDVPQDVTGDVTLNAKINWLVCRDICIPETKEISLTLPVAKSGETPVANSPEIFSAARTAQPIPTSWQGALEEQDQSIIITFQLEDEDKSELSQSSDFFFFPEEWGIILYAEAQDIKVSENKLTLALRRDSRALSEIQTLNGVLTYKSADGQKIARALSVPVMAQ